MKLKKVAIDLEPAKLAIADQQAGGWIIAQARSGNMLVSAIVPAIGEETRLSNVDFDEKAMTETLIVMARLSADGLMAIGGELHADEDALLIEQGGHQADLWGINLYPDRVGTDRVSSSIP